LQRQKKFACGDRREAVKGEGCNEMEANRIRGNGEEGVRAVPREWRETRRGHARAALGGRARRECLRPSCARLLLLSSPHSVQQLLTFTHSESSSPVCSVSPACIHRNPRVASAPHGSPAPLGGLDLLKPPELTFPSLSHRARSLCYSFTCTDGKGKGSR
jgi:hypothetical protein